jgi:hypothetical protein
MASIKFRSRHVLPDDTVEWVEYSGTPVVVPGYEQYTFIFHRRKELNGWFVSEYKTGVCVYPVKEYCKTREQAADCARQYLDMYWAWGNELDKGIELYLSDYNGGEPINKPTTKAKQRRLF